MHLRRLFENTNKTAVVAFGRMNPPTTGHMKLAETINSLPGDGFIFLSHTQKKSTDPLDFETKLKFAEQMFPNVTVGDPNVRTIIEALKAVESRGYNSLIYVAGEDRIDQFADLIHKYNGQEYNFNNIHVVSAGTRDPDAADASGMSASKLRKAAADGDLAEFSKGVADTAIAEAMYSAVRAGLGLTESDLTRDELDPAFQGVPTSMLTKIMSDNRKYSPGQRTRAKQEIEKQGRVREDDIVPKQQSQQPQAEAPVTPMLLKKLEQYLDMLFGKIGIDVEFTRHFLDRVNDERNKKQITIQELVILFRNTYSKYGKQIAQMGPDAQAVIKLMQSDINLPFVLNWDDRNQELDLVAKTIMRKKNFTTPNKELRV